MESYGYELSKSLLIFYWNNFCSWKYKKKIQERGEHFKRRVYCFLEFQTHPQESIYRVLQTSAFVWDCVKIIKAEKGSDFWLPFCLWELMHILGQTMAHFISCLETGCKRYAPMTHNRTGISAFKSTKLYTSTLSCCTVLFSVAQIKENSLNYKTRIHSLTFPSILRWYWNILLIWGIYFISLVPERNYRPAHVLNEGYLLVT